MCLNNEKRYQFTCTEKQGSKVRNTLKSSKNQKRVKCLSSALTQSV